MLLCTEQNNPIRYREKEILFPEELLNSYYRTYGKPVNDRDVGMLLWDAINYRDNSDAMIDRMSDESLGIVACIELEERLELITAWQSSGRRI